jgi:pimeloyl-ACP methyl ester carboxylesterase
LGGTLALWLASEGVEQLSHIVVVDGLPASGAIMLPDYEPQKLIYDSPWNRQLLEMDSVAFEGMARQMAAGMTLDTAAQAQIVRWMMASDRETYVYGYTDFLKLDLRKAVGDIEIPVAIIAATEPYGEVVARNTYQTQFRALADYRLTFVPDASHFVMYDQPERFMELLAGILKSP